MNVLLAALARPCGLKQQPSDSPFKGSLWDDNRRPEGPETLSFPREKGFLHSSPWFGWRMNSQGDERKKRSLIRSLSPAPLIFYFEMCFCSKYPSFCFEERRCLTSERQNPWYRTQWGADSGA